MTSRNFASRHPAVPSDSTPRLRSTPRTPRCAAPHLPFRGTLKTCHAAKTWGKTIRTEQKLTRSEQTSEKHTQPGERLNLGDVEVASTLEMCVTMAAFVGQQDHVAAHLWYQHLFFYIRADRAVSAFSFA